MLGHRPEGVPVAPDADAPIPLPRNERMWKALLLGTDPTYARTRRILQHLPSSPRCKMCAAPFGAPGGPLMRLIGRDRWSKNPKYCGMCFNVLQTHHGGAEIEATFLFADVRGSTSLAERVGPREFRRQLDRFYDTATRVLIDHDAIVDKFVGDEVVAMFIPALAHEGHAQRAVESGLALLRATGHDRATGPWLPIGIGIDSGVAFVGAVGEPPVTELTGLGDPVNTAARLASAAAAGELLVSASAASNGALDTSPLERRSLELKGKSAATIAFVATVASQAIAAGS